MALGVEPQFLARPPHKFRFIGLPSRGEPGKSQQEAEASANGSTKYLLQVESRDLRTMIGFQGDLNISVVVPVSCLFTRP